MIVSPFYHLNLLCKYIVGRDKRIRYILKSEICELQWQILLIMKVTRYKTNLKNFVLFCRAIKFNKNPFCIILVILLNKISMTWEIKNKSDELTIWVFNCVAFTNISYLKILLFISYLE